MATESRLTPVRTLVLGGIRSGKSRWAEEAIATSLPPGQPVCYLAPAVPRDPVRPGRVGLARHRGGQVTDRLGGWQGRGDGFLGPAGLARPDPAEHQSAHWNQTAFGRRLINTAAALDLGPGCAQPAHL